MRLNEKPTFQKLKIFTNTKYSDNSGSTDWGPGYLIFEWDETDCIWLVELCQNSQKRVTLRLNRNNIASIPRSLPAIQEDFFYINFKYQNAAIFVRPNSEKNLEDIAKAYQLVKEIYEGKYEKFRDQAALKDGNAASWPRPPKFSPHKRYENPYPRNRYHDDKYYANRYQPHLNSNGSSYWVNADNNKRLKLDHSPNFTKSPYSHNSPIPSPCSHNGLFELRSPPSKDRASFKPFSPNKDSLVNKDHKSNDSPSTSKSPDHSFQKIPGFANIGNTCYMNSVLQSLYNIEILTKDVLSLDQHIFSDLPDKSLIKNFLAVLRARLSGKVDKSYLESFKQALFSVEPSFSGDYQHDAHEFLSILLDNLKEEFNKLPLKEDRNPISKSFEFHLVNTLVCNKCQKVTPKEESFLMLSVEIPKPGSKYGLQDAIDQSLMPEKMEYKCEKCNEEDANCIKTFASLPRVLVLHLKRYHYSTEMQSVKVSTPVAAPTFVTLSPHITQKTRQPISTPSSPLVDKLPSGEQTSEEVLARLQLLNGLKGGREDVSHKKGDEALPSPSKPHEQPSTSSEQEMSEDTQVQMAMTQSLQDAEDLELQQALDKSIEECDSSEALPLSDSRQNLIRTEQEEQRIKDNLEMGHLPNSYKLCGVVSHSGKNAYNGHYVSDIFDETTQLWWHCNDEGVSCRPKSELLSHREGVGYLYFYIAKEALPQSHHSPSL